ncbi:MAG: hypothetical protein U5R48_14905 [Gammaproteobacteria bacterium]|nr:hypothetical protein [Gammaproteobacteria bacterium]
MLDNPGSLTTAAAGSTWPCRAAAPWRNATSAAERRSQRPARRRGDRRLQTSTAGWWPRPGRPSLFGSFDTSNTDASLGVTTLAGTTSIDTGVGDLTLGATTGNGNDWTPTADALTLGSLAGGGAVRLVDIVSSEVTNDFGCRVAGDRQRRCGGLRWQPVDHRRTGAAGSGHAGRDGRHDRRQP